MVITFGSHRLCLFSSPIFELDYWDSKRTRKSSGVPFFKIESKIFCMSILSSSEGFTHSFWCSSCSCSFFCRLISGTCIGLMCSSLLVLVSIFFCSDLFLSYSSTFKIFLLITHLYEGSFFWSESVLSSFLLRLSLTWEEHAKQMSNWEFIEIMLLHTFDLSLVSFMVLFIKLVHFSWFGLFSCGFSTFYFTPLQILNVSSTYIIPSIVFWLYLIGNMKFMSRFKIFTVQFPFSLNNMHCCTLSIDAKFCLHNYLYAATVTCSIHWTMFRDF